MSLINLQRGDESYDWIYNQMQDSIESHAGQIFDQYENVKVYKVENPRLWSLYEQRKAAISREMGGKGVNEMTLYHGTEDAMNIIKNGFDLKKADAGGMFGKGIYFAEQSSKSNQYTKAWYKACKEHQKQNCPMCVRHMLVCKVTLGKQYLPKKEMNGILAPPYGYHSVKAEAKPVGPVNYPEYVVYDNNQAFPAYLVKYQVKNVQGAGDGRRPY